ncbi:MAG: phospho-N-acetylmuramoyl-pentapeptide-transferase [Elusimicrobia bacterium]|nr:phospho-N-acetylmuramoyl-pentapeptide-transferase [Elusimicrobiota bacterium]
MLFYLLHSLKEKFFVFNVLRYITFRAAAAFITALMINFIVAPKIIEYLKNRKKLQVIRDDGPQTHLKKLGTPTMGGLIILISLVGSVLLWARLSNSYIVILVLSTLWLGGLGFADDYVSVSQKSAKGVSPAFKLGWQLLLGLAVAVFLYFKPPSPEHAHSLSLPFFKNLFINLGSFYIFFVIITVIATSNAVNLTDGLDGLAIGGVVFAAATYAILAYISGHAKFSEYLFLPYIKDAGEVTVYLAALAGAGLGFLWYNTFPAQIFMGDTGSLFIGGTIGISALIIKHEFLLLIVGGVFLMEIVSVVLQVAFYRWKGRRIFKMAPLHHHFELKGWSEPQVVIRFWIIAIILSLVALSTLKLR